MAKTTVFSLDNTNAGREFIAQDDGTNIFVGIGTEIPLYQLHVVGNAALAVGAAAVAGGSAVNYVALGGAVGSIPVVGLYFGSGAPSISVPKGSLYLRTDGSTTTSRMYVATDGAGTWTAVTTSA